MDRTTLIAELPAVLLAAVERPEPPGGLREDEPLFGPDARLDLDSLDALQLSMALQKRYRVRLTDSKETRRIFANLASLADYIANLEAQR